MATAAEKRTNEKLQKVQESMSPLIIALDDYLADTDDNPEDQPAIRGEANSLYSNLKGFLGSFHMHSILNSKNELQP